MNSNRDAHLEKNELYPKESTAEPKEIENASVGEGKTIGEFIYNYLMNKISLKEHEI